MTKALRSRSDRSRSGGLSRRRLLLTGAAGLAAGGLAAGPASAALRIDIQSGAPQPIPIAITDFVGEVEQGRAISGVISNDLKRSGLFAPSTPSPSRKTSRIGPRAALPGLARRQCAGPRHRGRVLRQGDGRLKVEFRLWDVFAGQQLIGQQYFTQPQNWRRVAISWRTPSMSGSPARRAIFDTRIVFVDETGAANRRVKRLAIMDQDGAEVSYLTRGDELVLTPRFSPTSQEITYMSYGRGEPASSCSTSRPGSGKWWGISPA